MKMVDLRELFETAGFTDVVTYIQSGNVLFSTRNADIKRLERLLEQKLEPVLGNRAKVFVFSQADLKQAVANCPFDPVGRDKELRCHLMFLSTEPDSSHRQALFALRGEEYQFHISDKVLYYAYPGKFAGKRRTIDFEKVLSVVGTSRSWKVVTKLIQLSS